MIDFCYGIRVPSDYEKFLEPFLSVRKAITYIDNQLNRLVKEVIQEKPVFISNIFYTIFCLSSLGHTISEDQANIILKYISKLKVDGGFCATLQEYVNWKEGVLPDFSSTFFGLSTLYVLDGQLTNDETSAIRKWIVSRQDKSGVFLREKSESSRKTENIFWAILSYELLNQISKSKVRLPQNVSRLANEFVKSSSDSFNYVTQKFYALRVLQILGQGRSIDPRIASHLKHFVDSHWCDASGGYYEFLFENVKGAHRVAGDTNFAYLHSTFYALLIKFLIGGGITERQKEKITEFIRSKQCDDGGMGVQIQIRTFEFGPKSTLSETLFALLTPAVLGRIKIVKRSTAMKPHQNKLDRFLEDLD